MRSFCASGPRALIAAASLGAALLVGAPAASASDPQAEYFDGYSSISLADARAVAVAQAADLGYTTCRPGVVYYGSFGDPVVYTVTIACG
jgi:hypothetical protein